MIELHRTAAARARASCGSSGPFRPALSSTSGACEGAPSYLDWISELAEKAPLGAVKIKIADNEDNNDPARIAQPPPAERDVSEYYTKARTILAAALARRAMG